MSATDSIEVYRHRDTGRRVIAKRWTADDPQPRWSNQIPVGYWLTRDEADRYESVPPDRFAAEYQKETPDA